MKLTRSILAVLIVVMSFCMQSWGQTFDLRFVVMQNNGTNYDVKIQINANGSQFNIGTSSLVFTYNTTDLSNPTLLAIHGFSGGNYLPMVINTTQPPRVAVSIELGVAPGLAVPLTPTDVATIRFTTLNPAGMSNLQWVTGGGAPTVVFKDDEATIVSAESLINLNTQPLPIQLATFTATVISQQQVRLDWMTLTETNNYGFEVQKSSDSTSNYQTIPNSFIPGHGTTIEPQNYSYIDSTAASGNWYYRLKQVDLDGTLHYSDGIRVVILTDVKEKSIPKEFSLSQNFPNPYNPSTTIRYALPRSSFVTLTVYNAIGQQVAQLVNELQEPGYHNVVFRGDGLASGVYFYRLQAGDYVATKKLALLK